MEFLGLVVAVAALLVVWIFVWPDLVRAVVEISMDFRRFVKDYWPHAVLVMLSVLILWMSDV